MYIIRPQSDIVGKAFRMTSIGVNLEKHYENVFGFGNSSIAQRHYLWCNQSDENSRICLVGVDLEPIQAKQCPITLYAFQCIGEGCNDDIYWYSLDQLEPLCKIIK